MSVRFLQKAEGSAVRCFSFSIIAKFDDIIVVERFFMELSEYVSEIKLELTGGVLELEISDEIISKVVMKSLKEIQRYIDESRYIEVPFSSCIDLTGFKCSSIKSVYRTEPMGGGASGSGSTIDPMYAQTWALYGMNNVTYNINQFALNYASYNTVLQIRNSISTDLAFKEDKQGQKLYINVSGNYPTKIVIEYIPLFEDVSEVKSPYWIDVLQRLSIAMVKKTLGRIRTRFTQSNALWQQDGETMLQEGDRELSELREILRTNHSLFYPVD